MPSTSRRLHDMDSRSVERALARDPVVIVPVGALEAHGPHLPLGADQLQAEATADALAARVDGLIAPTLPYGVCDGARGFPGTVSVSMEGLARSIDELLSELGRMGARRLLVLSGHAAPRHMAALREGVDRARERRPELEVLILSDYDFVYELRGKESPETDGHGGLLETSRVMAIAPQLVGPERPVITDQRRRFRAGDPTPSEWPESVVGDTRPANPDLGRRLQEHVLRRLEETVRTGLPK